MYVPSYVIHLKPPCQSTTTAAYRHTHLRILHTFSLKKRVAFNVVAFQYYTANLLIPPP